MKAQFTVDEVPCELPGAAEVQVLCVAGEIDTTNAVDFETAVNGASSAAAAALVLDLSPVSYCDSAAFAVLDRLLSGSSAVVVLSPANPVHRAASLMGLPLHDSLEAAVRAAGV